MPAFAHQPVCHCLSEYNVVDDRNDFTERDDETMPAMICVPSDFVHCETYLRGLLQHVSVCVARLVSRKALRANAKAMAAMGK